MKYFTTLCLAATFQTLFPQFQPDGPDAPDVEVVWNSGYVLALSNAPGSNNVLEMYQEYIPELAGSDDPFWRFQGYLIFQVQPGFSASSSNPFDPMVSRLIGSSDLADGQWVFSGSRHVHIEDDFGNVLLDTCYAEAINASDEGSQYTYFVTNDAFTGQPLTQEDDVCYVALAFATNPYWGSAACGGPDEILISRKAALGSIMTWCADGTNTAVAEESLGRTSSIVSNVDGAVQVRNAQGSMLQVFAVDGRCMLSHRVGSNAESVDLTMLPMGEYVAVCQMTPSACTPLRITRAR